MARSIELFKPDGSSAFRVPRALSLDTGNASFQSIEGGLQIAAESPTKGTMQGLPDMGSRPSPAPTWLSPGNL